MRRRTGTAAWVALALLVVTGCGSPAAPGSPAAASAAPSAAPTAFAAATLAGGRFDGAALAGRPALLWFWAPWCGTCAGQATTVRELAARHQGRLTVVGVAGLDEVPAMREFVDIFELEKVTHLADTDGAVWRHFGITAQSTYVLLDASGAVLHRGRLDNDVLTERIATLAATS